MHMHTHAYTHTHIHIHAHEQQQKRLETHRYCARTHACIPCAPTHTGSGEADDCTFRLDADLTPLLVEHAGGHDELVAAVGAGLVAAGIDHAPALQFTAAAGGIIVHLHGPRAVVQQAVSVVRGGQLLVTVQGDVLLARAVPSAALPRLSAHGRRTATPRQPAMCPEIGTASDGEAATTVATPPPAGPLEQQVLDYDACMAEVERQRQRYLTLVAAARAARQPAATNATVSAPGSAASEYGAATAEDGSATSAVEDQQPRRGKRKGKGKPQRVRKAGTCTDISSGVSSSALGGVIGLGQRRQQQQQQAVDTTTAPPLMLDPDYIGCEGWLLPDDECRALETARARLEAQLRDVPAAHGAAVSAAAQPVDGQRAHEALLCDLGDVYRRLGWLRRAEATLTVCIRDHPGSHRARWSRHLLRLATDRSELALEDLLAASKLRGEYRSHRSRGDLLLAAGNMEGAANAYDLALVFNGRDAGAHLHKARALAALGRMAAAGVELLLCLALAPHNAEASRLYASLLYADEQYAKAIQQYTRHIALCPQEATAYLHRGLACARMGRTRQAVLDLTQCVHLDPRCGQAYFCRGTLLARVDPRRAVRDLSVCLLLDDSPRSVLVYLQRGLVYAGMHKYAAAVPDFFATLRCEDMRRMLEGGTDRAASPASVCALYKLGLIHMRHLRKLAPAIRYFTRAVRADPTCVQALVARAECYHLLHRQSVGYQADFGSDVLWHAFRDYGRAIRLCPTVSQYRLLCGKVALDLGRLVVATRLLQEAAALDPDMGQAAAVRATVQSYLGRHADAVAGLLRLVFPHHALQDDQGAGAIVGLLRMWPPQVDTAARRKGVALLGEALLTAGSTNDALAVFDYLIRAGGGTAAAFYSLGMCCVAGGDDELAVEAFGCALRLTSGHSLALYQRGMCRLRLGRARGLGDVNKALAMKPRMWKAYLTRASHYAKQGKYPKAILNCNEVGLRSSFPPPPFCFNAHNPARLRVIQLDCARLHDFTSLLIRDMGWGSK